MTDITPELFEKLWAAAQAATPGPWEWEDGALRATSLQVGEQPDGTYEDGNVIRDPYVFHWNRGSADKAFIAAANPAVVLDLLRRIAALEGALQDQREAGCL